MQSDACCGLSTVCWASSVKVFVALQETESFMLRNHSFSYKSDKNLNYLPHNEQQI